MNKQTQTTITFYTKAGCHLCEEARDLLEEIAEQQDYILTEIDIRSDMAIFETYRYRIPVLVINQNIVLDGPIEAQELATALQQAVAD